MSTASVSKIGDQRLAVVMAVEFGRPIGKPFEQVCADAGVSDQEGVAMIVSATRSVTKVEVKSLQEARRALLDHQAKPKGLTGAELRAAALRERDAHIVSEFLGGALDKIKELTSDRHQPG